MFQVFGNAISRFWPCILVGWIALLIGLIAVAPAWDDVILDGEFIFLPENAPSRLGENLFQQAFPDDLLASSVVIVVRHLPGGLVEEDEQFITDVLEPRLIRIAERSGGLATESDSDENHAKTPSASGGEPKEKPIIARIRTFDGGIVGELLVSPDKKASLVIVELTTEFQEKRNRPVIAEIERLIDDLAAYGNSSTVIKLEGWMEKFAESGIGEQASLPEFEQLIGSLERDLERKPRHDPATIEDLKRFSPRLSDESGLSEEEETRLRALIRELRGSPPGLSLAISGSATVGRDMRKAAEDSADATEFWTILLVMILLILIYRAPILSLIPLSTVAMSVTISLSVLALLSRANVVDLFSGIEIYVTVILYGAGVDYCLFLIARYKEELDEGATYDEAAANALGKVGAALTASAGTVMCGIGMMVFAEFGKYQQAGVAISLSLFICLCAALTFTPSLLRLTGRWAFWPKTRQERIGATRGWISATSLIANLTQRGRFGLAWKKVGEALTARPGTIWLASIVLLLPFAFVGVRYYNHLTYGLLSELPPDDPSVVGAKAVQQHFPAGATGPVTLILENQQVDFGERTAGAAAVGELTNKLNQRKDELRLANIRGALHPLGDEEGLAAMGLIPGKVMWDNSKDYYVSGEGDWKGHVTRIDMVARDDPFSRHSIEQFESLKAAAEEEWKAVIEEMRVAVQEDKEQAVQEEKEAAKEEQKQAAKEKSGETADGDWKKERDEEWAARLKLADNLGEHSHFLYIGPTASIRDLKMTTDRDQIRIDIYVIIGVFLILVILLRRPAISAYLIVSVFFSYLATLGVTFAVFYLLNPVGFAGLDWKVPMFLFTILIAIGEDYNIFIMTRIEEEQARHGAIKGVTVALEKTGSIISSCGFIMAGTFSSLMAGTLVGMDQLGFALAFGVLLDTFVVRPIMVPAYLILLYSGRFGSFSRFLGAGEHLPIKASASVRTGTDA